jgi:hypothetical protein
MCLATASWLRTGAKIAAKPRDRPPPGLLPGTRAGSVRGGAEPHRRPPGRGDAAGAPWPAATQSLGGAPPTTAHPPPPPVIALARRPAHVVLPTRGMRRRPPHTCRRHPSSHWYAVRRTPCAPTRGMLRRPPHTCDRHPPSRWPAVRRTPCAPTRAPPADDRTPAAAICHRAGPPSGARRVLRPARRPPTTERPPPPPAITLARRPAHAVRSDPRAARRRPNARRRHLPSRWPAVRCTPCAPDPRGAPPTSAHPPPPPVTALARRPWRVLLP